MKSYGCWKPHIIEQYFSVVPFSIVYEVMQSFESVDEILLCDRSVKAIIGKHFHVVPFVVQQGLIILMD